MEISIKDAAELLGKSERTVRHMAQTGRLPARRIGSRWLINQDDLLARKAAGVGNDSDDPADNEPELDADSELDSADLDDSHESPRRPTRQPVTVNFSQPLPPGVVTSVRELDSFHIATDILAELGELRRAVKDGPLLRDAETHLREFLQLLTDGCHADLHTRRDRFREAQSKACAALTDLVHFNVKQAEPDLGPLELARRRGQTELALGRGAQLLAGLDLRGATLADAMVASSALARESGRDAEQHEHRKDQSALHDRSSQTSA